MLKEKVPVGVDKNKGYPEKDHKEKGKTEGRPY